MKNIGVVALMTVLALIIKSDVIVLIWFLITIICGIKIVIK